LGLGQPFDIHTGGIDLIFPHHENEIAQSTAGRSDSRYANIFMHSEHILVDDKKMSKSSGNFYTLADLIAKNIDPLAFRLLVLQSHYSKSTNFSLENVEAAHNRLHHWRNVAALRWQTYDTLHDDNTPSDDDHMIYLYAASQAMLEALNDNLNTPAALAVIDEAFGKLLHKPLATVHQTGLEQLLESIDSRLGLQLLASTPDISDEAKRLILERQRARDNKDWTRSDELREQLSKQGIAIRDTTAGSIWEYTPK
ncbi:MAG TPA: class I tRNA ligase family protein, partial [Candidatus Saccharimonadales bacterium]|nr:class I tRNA ligase family protein [Candidatus Saccharimonadales bacterium]